MPTRPDLSAKALFDRFKHRTEGGDVAAFLARADGTVESVEPSKAKALTPQKLKARLQGKGIAGSFHKGRNGTVFQVVAAKKGGKADQPWVKYNLRAALAVASFEVAVDPEADLDDIDLPDPSAVDDLSLLDDFGQREGGSSPEPSPLDEHEGDPAPPRSVADTPPPAPSASAPSEVAHLDLPDDSGDKSGLDDLDAPSDLSLLDDLDAHDENSGLPPEPPDGSTGDNSPDASAADTPSEVALRDDQGDPGLKSVLE